MKKESILAFFILVLAISIPMNSVNSVSVGNSFVFNIKKAYGSFSYTTTAGTTEGNTSLFRVGNTGIAKGQDLEVEVTSVESSSVGFKISNNGTQLTTATSSGLSFGLGLILYSLYPFIVMGISTGTVNPIDPTKGVSLGDIWYIAPPSVSWSGIADYYNNTANWQGFYDDMGTNEEELNVTSYATYYDEGETISFIISASGNYGISSESTYLTIIHTLRFDYNVTSYVLQGYNMFTLITGTYQGDDTTFSMNVQVAEENYTRRLGIPSFVIGLGAILSISITYAIFKKK